MEKYIKYEFYIIDNSAVLLKCDTNSDIVVVPEKYKGYDVVMIYDYCFINNQSIREVIIPSTILQIGKKAFKGCRNLENINLHEPLIIKEYAFYDTKIDETIINYHEHLREAVDNYYSDEDNEDFIDEELFEDEELDELDEELFEDEELDELDEEDIDDDREGKEVFLHKDGFYYYFENDEAVITHGDEPYYFPKQNLKLPTKIKGVPVSRIGTYAFADATFNSLICPSSINDISDHAFTDSTFNFLKLPSKLNSLSPTFIDSYFFDQILPLNEGKTKFRRVIQIPQSITNYEEGTFKHRAGVNFVSQFKYKYLSKEEKKDENLSFIEMSIQFDEKKNCLYILYSKKIKLLYGFDIINEEDIPTKIDGYDVVAIGSNVLDNLIDIRYSYNNENIEKLLEKQEIIDFIEKQTKDIQTKEEKIKFLKLFLQIICLQGVANIFKPDDEPEEDDEKSIVIKEFILAIGDDKLNNYINVNKKEKIVIPEHINAIYSYNEVDVNLNNIMLVLHDNFEYIRGVNSIFPIFIPEKCRAYHKENKTIYLKKYIENDLSSDALYYTAIKEDNNGNKYVILYDKYHDTKSIGILEINPKTKEYTLPEEIDGLPVTHLLNTKVNKDLKVFRMRGDHIFKNEESKICWENDVDKFVISSTSLSIKINEYLEFKPLGTKKIEIEEGISSIYNETSYGYYGDDLELYLPKSINYIEDYSLMGINIVKIHKYKSSYINPDSYDEECKIVERKASPTNKVKETPTKVEVPQPSNCKTINEEPTKIEVPQPSNSKTINEIPTMVGTDNCKNDQETIEINIGEKEENKTILTGGLLLIISVLIAFLASIFMLFSDFYIEYIYWGSYHQSSNYEVYENIFGVGAFVSVLTIMYITINIALIPLSIIVSRSQEKKSTNKPLFYLILIPNFLLVFTYMCFYFADDFNYYDSYPYELIKLEPNTIFFVALIMMCFSALGIFASIFMPLNKQVIIKRDIKNKISLKDRFIKIIKSKGKTIICIIFSIIALLVLLISIINIVDKKEMEKEEELKQTLVFAFESDNNIRINIDNKIYVSEIYLPSTFIWWDKLENISIKWECYSEDLSIIKVGPSTSLDKKKTIFDDRMWYDQEYYEIKVNKYYDNVMKYKITASFEYFYKRDKSVSYSEDFYINIGTKTQIYFLEQEHWDLNENIASYNKYKVEKNDYNKNVDIFSAEYHLKTTELNYKLDYTIYFSLSNQEDLKQSVEFSYSIKDDLIKYNLKEYNLKEFLNTSNLQLKDRWIENFITILNDINDYYIYVENHDRIIDLSFINV